jgi:hypothetical protein
MEEQASGAADPALPSSILSHVASIAISLKKDLKEVWSPLCCSIVEWLRQDGQLVGLGIENE